MYNLKKHKKEILDQCKKYYQEKTTITLTNEIVYPFWDELKEQLESAELDIGLNEYEKEILLKVKKYDFLDSVKKFF